MDYINIENIIAETFVGVYPGEQKRRQPIRLDLRLALDTRKAGFTDNLRNTVDYACLGGEVRFLVESFRFSLLETTAEAIASYTLASPTGLDRAEVLSTTVKIMKLKNLEDSSGVHLTIERSKGQYAVAVEDRPFGQVDEVFSISKCGVYRLRVGPGKSIPTHVHRTMEESEMILTNGLLLQGEPAKVGSGRAWPKSFPHRYDNPTEKEQVILCVNRPRFETQDEIPVSVPISELKSVAPKLYYPESHIW